MKIVRVIPSRLREWPIDGAGSDINEGAVLMPGSGATQLSALIKASGAAADSPGLLAAPHTSSEGDVDPEAGAVFGAAKRQVYEFHPGCEVAAEYDQATVLTVSSYSDPTITVSSIPATRPGGWVYVVSGAGIGQLGYVISTASGSLTLKSGFTTDLDSTSRIIWIRERFAALHTLSSDADKIITSAANGTLPWVSLRSEYKFAGEEGWLELDPTKHHDQQLDGLSPVFQDIFSPRDTLKNPGA